MFERLVFELIDGRSENGAPFRRAEAPPGPRSSLTRVYPLSRRDIIRNCRLGQRAEPGYLSELTLPVSGVTCHGFFTSSDVTSPRVVFLRDSTSLREATGLSCGGSSSFSLSLTLLVITVVKSLFIHSKIIVSRELRI